jgi:hypothetical protein
VADGSLEIMNCLSQDAQIGQQFGQSETINGIDGPLVGDGFGRIVAPGDARGSRYVSNLTIIEVRTAAPVPEPETWAMMGAGLCALALAGRRRNSGRQVPA